MGTIQASRAERRSGACSKRHDLGRRLGKIVLAFLVHELRIPVVLTDCKNFIALHLRWCAVFVLAIIAASVWYYRAAASSPRWPGGGSGIGLVFGGVAGAIMLFEMALWFRKTTWFRTCRCFGSAQLWMKAHIWLGLLTVPLVVMHSGFRLGGEFTMVLMGTFFVVIGSGVFGLVMQNVLPRRMLEELPQETIYSQIDEVARQFAADAARIVALTCGEADRGEPVSEMRREVREREHVVGAPRRVGTVVVRTPRGNVDFPRGTKADALLRAFDQDIRPFLESSGRKSGPLSSRRQARDYFTVLRNLVSADAHPAVAAIEQLSDRCRDLPVQRRIHRLLHGWLAVHLPLSVALILLLIVHVVYAIRLG